jgi:hypothetical protein
MPIIHLGKYATLVACYLQHLGWAEFIQFLQHPADASNDIDHLDHPASRYLHRLALHEVPSLLQAPQWSLYQWHKAHSKGPYISPLKEYHDFILEDMWDIVQKQ